LIHTNNQRIHSQKVAIHQYISEKLRAYSEIVSPKGSFPFFLPHQKVMKVANLFFSFFLLLLISSNAQQINFTIQLEGKTVGNAEVWVNKYQQEQTYAFLVAEITSFPLNVSSITSMYEDGKLLSASSRVADNHINIKGDGQYYHAISQGTYTPLKSDWVNTGLAKLFCERPYGTDVLIEAVGEVKPIQKIDANTYGVQLNNGAEIAFTYKSNDCIAVKISHEGKEWKLTRMDSITL